MSCVLRMEGINFKVDDYLQSIDLKPYRVYRKGEKIKFGKIKYEKTNGCCFDLSTADFNDFKQQRKDAIKFLQTHFDQLKTVFSFGLTEKENPTIDFGITTRMHDFAVQCDYLEPELLKLAGNLNFGMEISQYHPTREENESE